MEIVCKLIPIVNPSMCSYINVYNVTQDIILIIKMHVWRVKHLQEILIAQSITVKMFVWNVQKVPSSQRTAIALLLILLASLMIIQQVTAWLVTLDTKFHKEHVCYQQLAQTPIHTVRNGKDLYANNVPQEAILITMGYVLLLILIVRNLIKDFVFLAMMALHFRLILVSNHRYNHHQILYAPNGKARYASSAQSVPF
mgnify:CR=1 FL=1